jgi:ubiquinone/menaquinone biosynthesis C-methylase UbiE
MAVARDDYLPAAGKHWLLPLYDPLLALLTGERHWRGRIIASLDLRAGDKVVDVGCGTGTLAIMAKQVEPGAEIIGVDPDPNALAIAAKKASRKNAAAVFRRGFGDETAKLVGAGSATKAVSSLALHHMPREMALQTIAAMGDALKPGGAIRIADFVAGHFGGAPEGDLVQDLTAAGFENARVLHRFRVAFSDAVLVAAEKPAR